MAGTGKSAEKAPMSLCGWQAEPDLNEFGCSTLEVIDGLPGRTLGGDVEKMKGAHPKMEVTGNGCTESKDGAPKFGTSVR